MCVCVSVHIFARRSLFQIALSLLRSLKASNQRCNLAEGNCWLNLQLALAVTQSRRRQSAAKNEKDVGPRHSLHILKKQRARPL